MSATMLEAYDTPMELQTDIDMNPSSSDMWFQDEAPMEDDGHPFYPQKLPIFDAAHVDIEVDMESYDIQVTEYEMDDEAHQQEEEELQDVEVFDASNTNSPAVAAGSEIPEETAGIATPKFLDSIHSDSNSLQFLASQSSAVQSPIETVVRPVDSSDFVLSGVSDSSATRLLPEEQHSMKEIQETAERVELETPVLESTVPEISGANKGETDLSHNDFLATVPKNLEEPSEEPVTENLRNVPIETDSDQDQVLSAEAGDSSAVSTGDPHEISEGVYIDPPPAVLLSLLSLEQDNMSLFNEPRIGDLSQTEDVDESPNVLLEHLPTLYYEPLSSVFEALRQEEYVAKLQDLADGELVLDAYDLELSIAEDNVYAREVSLHDLNVLHDASGLSGPLRLSLRASVPRFIIRYHSLQEQTARLNLEQTTGNLREEHPVEQDLQVTENQHDKETSDAPQEQAEQNNIQNLEQDEPEREPDDVPDSIELASYEDNGPSNQQEANDTSSSSETWLRQSDNAQTSTYLETDSYETDPHEPPDASDATDGTEIPDDGNQTNSVDHDDSTELYGDDHVRYGETNGENSADPLVDCALHTSSHDDLKFLPSPRQAESPSPLEEGPDHVTVKGEESSTSVSIERQISQIAEIPAADDSLQINTNDEVVSETLPNDTYAEYPLAGEELAEDGWDYDLDGDGEPDTNWEAENEHDSPSNESSVTLSSKTSKRSFDELERDNEVEDEEDVWSLNSSPQSLKRARVG